MVTNNASRVIASAAVGLAFLLAACGESTTENVTNINQMGMAVVASVSDLPECSKDNEGEQALVKGETSVRVCVDGEWFATESTVDTLILAGDTVYMQGGKDTVFVASGRDTVYVNDNKFSCTTRELADSSGIKIVCNGDSIGVVLNGAKGDKGDPGKEGTPGQTGAGCTLKDRTDSTVTVACGDSTMVMELGHAADDTATIGLEALEGYTQKGPFLKSSTVYLYELNGSLGQTNGNFTSVITSDDGRYKFRTRGLKYPYAMVVVDGYYRNEVTGKTSDAPIRLRAITDVSGRVTGSVNVNLLTHLEYERVNKLATGPGKLKLKEAKQKAQKEILAQFHIDTTMSWNTQSEDMNVFGKSDADAALLAISILLQGEGSANDLSVLLTQISEDMADDGTWNGVGSDSIKGAIAIWALNNHGRLETFRKNVESWNLGPVPQFEKYIDVFIEKSLGIESCGESNEGKSLTVENKYSPFHGQTFVCKNGNYVAVRLEKTHFNSDIHYGEMMDMRDHKVYKTVDIGNQTWMAENLDFADSIAYPALKTGMRCFENEQENCDRYGRLYARGIAFDTLRVYSNGVKECFATINGFTYKGGAECHYSYPVRGICPEGWHLPSANDWLILFLNFTSAKQMIAKDSGGTDIHGLSVLPTGVWSGNFYYSKVYDAVAFWHVQSSPAGRGGNIVEFGFEDEIEMKPSIGHLSTPRDDNYYPLRCLKDREIEYGLLEDKRDGHKYKTVEIAGKVWMAENLNFRTEPVEGDSSSFCHTNNAANCEKYGRYYTWESAQTVCPQGWHIPDSTEWANVYRAHGLSSFAMLAMGFDRAPFAENSLGLGLIPGMGRYDRFKEDFSNGGEYVWSSYTRNGYPYAWYNQETDDYNIGRGRVDRLDDGAIPVRCVKDDEP